MILKKTFIIAFAVSACCVCMAQDAIGTTKGELSVSPAGAAVYEIPIQARDGYSNFTPKIALTYNSLGDNDVVGYGWGISGVSTITSAAHTPYFDGSVISGVGITSSDAYCLDGMRLLRISGSNGKKNSQYVTEQEQYAKIYIDSAFSATPKSFVVKRPDGSTLRYGSTSTGIYRYSSTSGADAFAWLLDYAEDKDGNFINYTYTYYNSVPYLTRIDYGGNKNTGRAAYCTISLGYENRPDTIVSIVKAKKFLRTKRLASVTCTYDTYTYRRYVLQYNTSGYYSHLASVKEYGTGSQGLPSSTFTWSNLPQLQLTSTQTDVTGQEYTCLNHEAFYFSGDVDNDGVADLISLCPHSNGYSKLTVFKKNGSDFERVNQYNTSTIYDSSLFKESNLFNGGFVAHLNQSHNNAMVITSLPKAEGFPTRVLFECQAYNGGLCSFSSELLYTNEMPAYMYADYNKDGIDEIKYIEKKNLSDSKIRLVNINVDLDNANQFTQTEQLITISGLTSTQKQKKIKGCLSSDFDGDGLVDILVSCETFSIVLWNSNGSFSASNRTILTSIKHGDTLQPADFNGDGLADLIVNEASSTTWKKAVSTGQRSASLFSVTSIPVLSSLGFKMQDTQDSLYFCMVNDLDADGLSDLVVSGKVGTTQKVCWVKAERNGSLTLKGQRSSTIGSGCLKCWQLTLGDFDGDGYTEMVGYGGDMTAYGNTSKHWKLYKGCDYTPAINKLVSVTDGLGKVTSINYGSLLDGYTSNTSATYPLIAFNYPLPVVKGVTDTWQGTSHQTTYGYSDGICHLTGKGFLGFGSHRVTTAGITAEVALTFGGPYAALLSETMQSKDSQGNVIKSAQKQYSISQGNAAKSFHRLLSSEFLTDAVANKTSHAYYSDYHQGKPGNVSSGSNLTANTTYEYTDITTGGRWMLSLPTSITTEFQNVDEDNNEHRAFIKTAYMYDTAGRVISKRDFKSDTEGTWYLANTDTFQYNTGG